MNPETLVYALGIAGGVIALARNIFFSFALNVNAKVLTEQLIKLLRSDNVDRALKLCRVVESKYYGAGVIRALEAHQAGGARRKDLIEAFEQGLATKKSTLAAGSVISVVAGIIALAGLVYGVLHAENVNPQTYAAPAGGLFLAAGGFMLSGRLQRDAGQQFGRLLEVFGELAKR